MWPFSHKSKEITPKDLVETVEGVRRDFRRLQEEWDTVYEKFRLLHMRISKRVQREEELRAAEAAPTQEEEVVNNPPGTQSLSPRAQSMQRRILLRRSRLTQGR